MSAWTRSRAEAIEAVTLLRDVLADSNASAPRLVAAYLDAKVVLASAYEVYAVERYDSSDLLATTCGLVLEHMRNRFSHLPPRYIRLKSYGRSHRLILACLAERVGEAVPSSELRVLTGDAVHTERRARDLRDLGFDLRPTTMGGGSGYLLTSARSDASLGAKAQLRWQISQDKGISPTDRANLLATLG